ncbi:MAG: hypothetical protein ACRES4_08590 [Nevskiales bacterium]
MNDSYEITGSIASPFSLKLRAILRYRHLPHVWRLRRLDMGPVIESVKPKLMPMLASHSYLPFMAANAAAADSGQESFETQVCGHPYRRAPFGYQVKCYREVRVRWAELPPDGRESLLPLLTETGCLQYLQ